MKKREIPPRERRVVSKKKKAVILVLFAVGLIGIILFKLPSERTYTRELMLQEAGERALYGELIDVEIRVKVQRYFFSEPTHTGTVTVNGDVYKNHIGGTLVPAPSLTGAFSDTDTFEMICEEIHGDYILTRCAAGVKGGYISSVTLWDSAGVYVGRYGPMPKGSE